jgi:hypothetical protein
MPCLCVPECYSFEILFPAEKKKKPTVLTLLLLAAATDFLFSSLLLVQKTPAIDHEPKEFVN